MLEDEESSEIVRTIITLAKNLGKDTVAEGVENAEQLEVLRRLGCARAQGHIVSAALSGAELRTFLTDYRPTA